MLCQDLLPSPSWRSFSSSGPSGFSGFTKAALKINEKKTKCEQNQTQRRVCVGSPPNSYSLRHSEKLRLSVLPFVFWISGHHNKCSIQNWGVSSITVLKEESHHEGNDQSWYNSSESVTSHLL